MDPEVRAIRAVFGEVEVLTSPPPRPGPDPTLDRPGTRRALPGTGPVRLADPAAPQAPTRPMPSPTSAVDAMVLQATTVALLEDLGPVGHLVRLVDGAHAGAEVVIPSSHLARVQVRDERAAPLHRRRATPEAKRRAEELLRSTLRESQRHQRATAGTFWVHNRHGWFRLGALYDVRVRSARRPWVERSVCVVSEGYEARPVADLWAELVVVLGADPTRVTAAANWMGEDRPRAPCEDRAGLTRWLACQRDEFHLRRAAGDELHAAYLAYDVAQRLRLAGRRRWALHYARRAAEVIDAWAARWPDEHAGLLDAHRDLLALPDEL